jgi:hypothetical protein
MEETIKKVMEIVGGLKPETFSEDDALLFLAHHERKVYSVTGGSEKDVIFAITAKMLNDADFERIIRLSVFYFNQYRKNEEAQ